MNIKNLYRLTLIGALLFSAPLLSKSSAANSISHRSNQSPRSEHSQQLINTSDSASIFQACLDMPGLQKYYPKNADNSYKQVSVMQFPVAFPVNLAVSKFQKTILFQSRGSIYTNKVDGFFLFKSLSISGASATVIFEYNYNYQSAPAAYEVSLTLQKTGDGWIISNSQTTNR